MQLVVFWIMIEMRNDVAGVFAETIRAVNWEQQWQNLLESLLRNAQELFNFKIRKYDGRSGKEASIWLKDIKEWLLRKRSQFDRGHGFVIMWRIRNVLEEFQDGNDNEYIHYEEKKLMEFVSVHKFEEERFTIFEIILGNLVDSILYSYLTRASLSTIFNST